jgi:hypothetical protein
VLRLADLDGLPAVTITAHSPPEPEAPTAAYLRWVCAGLREAYGWSPERVGRYLADCCGVRGRWSEDDLVDLAQTLRR